MENNQNVENLYLAFLQLELYRYHYICHSCQSDLSNISRVTFSYKITIFINDSDVQFYLPLQTFRCPNQTIRKYSNIVFGASDKWKIAQSARRKMQKFYTFIFSVSLAFYRSHKTFVNVHQKAFVNDHSNTMQLMLQHITRLK